MFLGTYGYVEWIPRCAGQKPYKIASELGAGVGRTVHQAAGKLSKNPA